MFRSKFTVAKNERTSEPDKRDSNRDLSINCLASSSSSSLLSLLVLERLLAGFLALQEVTALVGVISSRSRPEVDSRH